MTDNELTERAAQAAGIGIEPCTCSDKRFPFKHIESGKGHWSPLYDDGDAMRLAAKLEFIIDFKYGLIGRHGEHLLADFKSEDGNYRRAIVTAAAFVANATLSGSDAAGGRSA